MKKIRLKESDLKRIIGKVLNEQPMGWQCESGGVPGTPCQCVPIGIIPPPPGATTYQTLTDCQSDMGTCCGADAPPQEWCCAGGVTGQGQCIQVPLGTCNPGNMGTGYAGGPFPTQQACQSQCGGGTPDKYKCVNNSCTAISPSDPGYSNAPFQTMDDCLDSMCGERRRPIDKGNRDMERIIARALSEQYPEPPSPTDTVDIDMGTEYPAMSHDDFMDELHKMCPDIVNKKEKLIGNRSCSRCHSDIMYLLRNYCNTVI